MCWTTGRQRAVPLSVLAALLLTGAALSAQPAPLLDIPNAATPLPGMLTGGPPSEEALAAAADAGYKTIVDLRGPGEDAGFDEAARAEEFGLRYVSIPIASAADLTRENARLLGEVLDDADGHPLVLHCASSNRAGALLALRAFYFEGAPPADALELGRRAGMRSLEKAVMEAMEAEAATEGDAQEQ
jgi:protein tyrosine phosphatase (PTP) superfamily phosphohydrolase (DUF442 family)